MWISPECLSSTREYSVFDTYIHTYMGPTIWKQSTWEVCKQYFVLVLQILVTMPQKSRIQVSRPCVFVMFAFFALNILPLSRERNFHAYLSRQIPSYSGVSGPLQDIFVNNIQQEEASNCLVNPWDDRWCTKYQVWYNYYSMLPPTKLQCRPSLLKGACMLLLWIIFSLRAEK